MGLRDSWSVAVLVFSISVHFMPWNIDLNLNIDSFVLAIIFYISFIRRSVVARFLACHVEESRAGMEAKPLLFFPSTKYPGFVDQVCDLIQFFGLITFLLNLSLRINITWFSSWKNYKSLLIHCDADCSLELLDTWFDKNSYLSSKKADFGLSGPPKHLI